MVLQWTTPLGCLPTWQRGLRSRNKKHMTQEDDDDKADDPPLDKWVDLHEGLIDEEKARSGWVSSQCRHH
jgi:hypothetical protein